MLTILQLYILIKLIQLKGLLFGLILLNTLLIYLTLHNNLEYLRKGPINYYKNITTKKNGHRLIVHKYPQPITICESKSYTDYFEIIKKIIDILSFNLLWTIVLKKRPSFDIKQMSLTLLINYITGVSRIILTYLFENKNSLWTIDYQLLTDLNVHLRRNKFKRLIGYNGSIICEDIEFISNQEATKLEQSDIVLEEDLEFQSRDYEYALYYCAIDHEKKTITYLTNHKWKAFLIHLSEVIQTFIIGMHGGEASLLKCSEINDLESITRDTIIKYCNPYYNTFFVVELLDKDDAVAWNNLQVYKYGINIDEELRNRNATNKASPETLD